MLSNQVFVAASRQFSTDQSKRFHDFQHLASQFQRQPGMEFVNSSGTIQGTGTNAFVINLGSGTGGQQTHPLNAKQRLAWHTATAPAEFFSNSGTMTANDGSALTFQGSAVNVNLAEGDLVGGTWKAIANGHGATLTLSSNAVGGGPVNTDAAVLTLQSAGSIIQSFDTATSTLKPLEQTLTKIAAGGQLQVLATPLHEHALDLVDGGTIQLGFGTFSSPTP